MLSLLGMVTAVTAYCYARNVVSAWILAYLEARYRCP
jgi:hypothetical protein